MSTPELNLSLDVEEVKKELAMPEPTSIAADPAVDPELDEKASRFADSLLGLDPDDPDAQAEAGAAVMDMGRELQREAARRSQMLKQPIHQLAQHGDEGGPVANALVELKVKVEELDPAGLDFEAGWLTRSLGWIPGIGTPLKRYFTRFESAQTVIDAIINSLEKGRDQLERDNVTLREDRKAMRDLTVKLERQVRLGQLLDHKLAHKTERELAGDATRREFVLEQLLFPLRQRIMDLQQQLAVNQQGVLATAIVMRNNAELIRGVDRALDVTVSALQVAVTVALALANQRIVLDKVNALNQTTSGLIAGTAERLRTQGAEIHRQASEAMIDVETLKGAFADIKAAMDEIARYRQEALPRMAQTIVEFDRLATEGEAAIERLEHGERARPRLSLLAS